MTRTQFAFVAVLLLARAAAHAAEPGAAPVAPPKAAAPAANAPGQAQAPVEATPAAQARATDIARLVLQKEDWSRAVDMLAQDVQSRLQGHPGSQLKFPPDFGTKVHGEVAKALPYDDLVAMHAKELSRAFTEPELTDLLAFYRTPLGQKSLKVLPTLAGNVSQQSQARFEQKMPEIMQRLSSGLKHPESSAGGKAPAKAAATPSKPAKPAKPVK
jgi:hypothetical protein